MRIDSRSLLFGILIVVSLVGREIEGEDRFHIQKCSSGVEYPTEGDESIDIEYGDRGHHVRILHPRFFTGPHFSSPFFWVSKSGEVESRNQFIAVRTVTGGLTWNSINGYFFAENKGSLRGFFLEDGCENADFGSSGLLFLFDGDKCSAWKWSYLRQAEEKKGTFHVTEADDPTKPAPSELLKQLSQVFEHAEAQADAWPGP